MRLAFRDAGQGSPVVLLHGLFGSARNLGGVARALAASHRVVSIDLRNHGDSPHAPGMDYATMAGDVAETMDAAGLAEPPCWAIPWAARWRCSSPCPAPAA